MLPRTCTFYSDPADPPCGAPAALRIQYGSKIANTIIYRCNTHASMLDQKFVMKAEDLTTPDPVLQQLDAMKGNST